MVGSRGILSSLTWPKARKLRRTAPILKKRADELRSEGFVVNHVLAMGEPSDEIVKFVRAHNVDLIAMSTHGHRFISDLLYGSTADKVRHLVNVTGTPPQGESLGQGIELP